MRRAYFFSNITIRMSSSNVISCWFKPQSGYIEYFLKMELRAFVLGVLHENGNVKKNRHFCLQFPRVRHLKEFLHYYEQKDGRFK